MARRRSATHAEIVQLATEWLADKGIAANIIFKDGAEWSISGHNFHKLPSVLRTFAKECEARLSDDSVQ